MLLNFPALTTPEPHRLFVLAKSPLNCSGDIAVGGEVYGNVRTKWETPNCGLRSTGKFKFKFKFEITAFKLSAYFYWFLEVQFVLWANLILKVHVIRWTKTSSVSE
jgi:hypothetical protein